MTEDELGKIHKIYSDKYMESKNEGIIEKRDNFADVFFRVITDFIKWTTTISIAIIFFITNLVSTKDSQNYFSNSQLTIFYFSILFLIISVIIAIFLFSNVMTYWSHKWHDHQIMIQLLSTKLPENLRPEVIRYILDSFSKSSDQHLERKYWAHFSHYQYIMLFHLYMMLAGIIVFIIGYFIKEPSIHLYIGIFIVSILYIISIIFIHFQEKKYSKNVTEKTIKQLIADAQSSLKNEKNTE